MPDRPQKYTGRGATLGWLHHVNLAASNVQACSTFFQQHLDFHHRAYIVAPGTDFQAASFLSTGTLDHDLTFTMDPDGAHGRLNHLAFAVQTREDITRAADILTDYDPASLQTAPGASWASSSMRENRDNCIEIYTPETLILAPDWEPVRWLDGERATMYWGSTPLQAAFAVPTPPIEETEAAHLRGTAQ